MPLLFAHSPQESLPTQNLYTKNLTRLHSYMASNHHFNVHMSSFPD